MKWGSQVNSEIKLMFHSIIYVLFRRNLRDIKGHKYLDIRAFSLVALI